MLLALSPNETPLMRTPQVINSVNNAEGVSVGELFDLLAKLIQRNPDIRNRYVALCLPEVESSTTLITGVTNEGDDSIVWLSLSTEAEQMSLKGFGE